MQKNHRIRTVLTLALVGAVIASLCSAAAASTGASGAGASAGSAPTVVANDDPGDWGSNVDATLAPLGAGLGQDLTQATIEMGAANRIDFTIKVASLPPMGGWPEISRYVWSLQVDGKYAELDGKFTNYSRGTCDPTAESCPPPRDPGMSPFAIRGDCVTNEEASLTTCKEIGLVEATFDAAAATIKIPVPCDMLRAKAGTVIEAGSSDFTSVAGGAVVAIPSVFVSSTGFPLDAMAQTGKFTATCGSATGGGGGGELQSPKMAMRISNRNPARGKVIKFNIRARNCKPEVVGTKAHLQRKVGGRWKTIAKKPLTADCRALFKMRANFKKATFRSYWPKQAEGFKAGQSRGQTVTTH